MAGAVLGQIRHLDKRGREGSLSAATLHKLFAFCWEGQQSAMKLVLSRCIGGVFVVELVRNKSNFLALHSLHKHA